MVGNLPYQWLLEVCYVLFLLRVVGQIYVYYRSPTWLPPFERWYSETISYRAVLGWQAYMVAISSLIVLDLRMGLGVFDHWFWRSLCPIGEVISFFYFFGMVLRYVRTMVLYPKRRYFQGTLPIWFHMVVAIFLFCVSQLYQT